MQGLQEAVKCILAVPNVTEQRDADRATPLMLARKRGCANIEAVLLAAGAKDMPHYHPCAAEVARWSGMIIALV